MTNHNFLFVHFLQQCYTMFCPEGAIAMDNNLPVIDYEKCTGCGTCAGVCPAKCILPRPVAKSESA